mgnify:CR=1 FL=1
MSAQYLRRFIPCCCIFGSLACASTADSGEPVAPAEFRHARIGEAWEKYANVLTFGEGQTLALIDDGCKLSMPEWSMSAGTVPKVRVSRLDVTAALDYVFENANK